MKRIVFAGFLVLGSLAIVLQVSAISESNKVSPGESAKAPVKSSTPKDLVYYRNIISPGSNAGC
jgi:hypothetical protein